MTSPLDRQATCPNCGATITFHFAGAKAEVCTHCRFVVARTDQNLVAIGKMADLVDIPTPLPVGATGRWNNEPFSVEGRVQLDRAGAPGAPWQETLVSFPQTDRWVWVASAQGRWYATSSVPIPAEGLPHWRSMRPGRTITIGQYGTFTVAEVGQRRVISAEGGLPHVAAPEQVTRFVDVGGPEGAFGTIDYGDDQKIPAELFIGKQFDPAEMVLDTGVPIEAAQAKVEALACPNCGGNLPIVTPGTTERIVCRYCGMVSDLNQGALVALKAAPRPPVEPDIPLGAEGKLGDHQVTCIGFVIRGCTVDGDRYHWREYLLYAGPRTGYLWLMEEDGAWRLVTPIPPGSAVVVGDNVAFRGRQYSFKQSVRAQVEYVVGEFYWRVEIGEEVQATDYESMGSVVSVEEAPTEVTHSLCAPIDSSDVGHAFGVNLASGGVLAGTPIGGGIAGTFKVFLIIGIVIFFLFIICAMSVCGGGGGGGGIIGGGSGPGMGGPHFGGGK